MENNNLGEKLAQATVGKLVKGEPIDKDEVKEILNQHAKEAGEEGFDGIHLEGVVIPNEKICSCEKMSPESEAQRVDQDSDAILKIIAESSLEDHFLATLIHSVLYKIESHGGPSAKHITEQIQIVNESWLAFKNSATIEEMKKNAKAVLDNNPSPFQTEQPQEKTQETPQKAESLQGFRNFSKGVHKTAVDKGWWDGSERNQAEAIALMHSELSEALEGLREGNPADDKIPEFSAVEAELADVIIRICDFAEGYGYDVISAMEAKALMNKDRPKKHGGKLF